MHFKFPFNLINKLTMVLLTNQQWCVLKSWYRGGSPEHGFLHCFADPLNQKLSSFCGACYCTLLVQAVINLIFLPGKGNWSASVVCSHDTDAHTVYMYLRAKELANVKQGVLTNCDLKKGIFYWKCKPTFSLANS